MSVPDSLGDLLRKLGSIRPERIILSPRPGTATEEDVLWYEGRADKRLCELVDGVLVEKVCGFPESILTVHLGVLIDGFVRPINLGLVAGPDAPVRMVNGHVRMPDVSFFSWDRLPNRAFPREPIACLAPNLAVEIVSASNTLEELRMKRQDYFASGVALAWEVDPAARLVRVYTAVEDFQELTTADTLDGGAVLPGFALPVARLFAELDRHG